MKYGEKKIFVHVTRDSETGKKNAAFGGEWGNMSKADANSEGTLTGNGLMVVDIDTKYLESIDKKLIELLGKPTVETYKGYHYYFTGDVDDVKQTQGLFKSVDIRNKGGFVFSKYWGEDETISYKQIGEPQKLSDELKNYLTNASKTKHTTDNIKIGEMVDVEGTWDRVPEGEIHQTILKLMVREFKNGATYDEIWTKSMLYIDKYLGGNHRHEDKLFKNRIDDTYKMFANERFGFKASPKGFTIHEPIQELIVVSNEDIIENISEMILDENKTTESIIQEIMKISQSVEREVFINELSQTRSITKTAIREDLNKLYKTKIRENFKPIFPDYRESDFGFVYLSTLDNMKKLIKNEKVNFFYDVILKDVQVKSFDSENNWKSRFRSHILSQAIKSDLPQNIIDNHFDVALRSKERNPLMDTIERIQWDGKDHITSLAKTLKSGTGDFAYRRDILMRWLIQCVASWDNAKRTPNKKAIPKYELIFVLGGGQGVKKTTFFYNLMPKKMSKYLLTGAILKVGDRDSVKQVTSFGVVELGELDATTKKSDIAEIKAFASNTHDVYRVAYGRDDERHHRRTSFCASVNPTSFLNDATGARRFAYIRLDSEVNTKDIDIMQVWSQALKMYLDGERWWLLPTDDSYKIQCEVNEDATSAGTVGDTAFEFKKDFKKHNTKKAKLSRCSASQIWEHYRKTKPSKVERDLFYMELEKIEGLRVSRKNGISVPNSMGFLIKV